jgi:hypothetical protein
VCTRLHGDGQQCPPSVVRSCADPQVCMPSSNEVGSAGLCVPTIAAEGGVCGAGVVTCDTGLGCFSTSDSPGGVGQCVSVPVESGGQCSVPGALCATGLNCVTGDGSLSGVCGSGFAGVGAACGPLVAACTPDILSCYREPADSSGVCGFVENVPNGGLCTDDANCDSGSCVVPPGVTVGTCGTEGGGVGGTCTSNSDCASLLRCSRTDGTGVCYVPRFVGEPCSSAPTEQCLPGWFVCQDSSCTFPATFGTIGASCESNPACGPAGICFPFDEKYAPLAGARCRPLLSVGQTCTANPADGVCQPGTQCNGEFCESPEE